MSQKEEAKKASPKIRVWVNRSAHEKIVNHAKSSGKKIIEAYDDIIAQGLSLEVLKSPSGAPKEQPKKVAKLEIKEVPKEEV